MPARILVADDDPDIRNFYRMVLQDHFELIFARDGVEAWRLYEEEKPRLVVTDLNMPGMNGLELTGKIRNESDRPKTPIIILTGTTRDSDLPPGFWNIGAGANKFMEKPIRPDELVAEIRRQLTLFAEANRTPLPPGKGFY
ncbi:response regulator [bacterium]|nr:response regulator [bacterium]